MKNKSIFAITVIGVVLLGSIITYVVYFMPPSPRIIEVEIPFPKK